jgi:hypothetical protein
MKRKGKLAQIEKCRPNKEKIKIPLIHITFPHPVYVIRPEGKLEDLKKKFDDAIINHLGEAKKRL